MASLAPTSEVTVHTVAGGEGVEAHFNYSYGVAIALDRTVLVADTSGHRIRTISPASVVSTLAGGEQGFKDGEGAEAQFNYPCGVAVAPDGTVLVADTFNNRIRAFPSFCALPVPKK
jgi:DNA-binding beta-propeller fold protein YncE